MIGAVVVLTGPAPAADLAERMPSGTFLYVGWPGVKALGAAAQDTAWARMLAEDKVVQFRRNWNEAIWPALDRFLRQQVTQTDETRIYELALASLSAFWEHPAAFGIASVGPGKNKGDPPVVDMGLVLRAGPQSPRLAERLDDVFAAGGVKPAKTLELPAGKLREIILSREAIPIWYGHLADDAVFCMGERFRDFWTAAAPGRSLRDDANYAAAVRFVHAGPDAPLLYGDFEQLAATFEKFQPVFAEWKVPLVSEPGGVRRVLAGLGLDNLKSFCLSTRPAAGGFQATAFLHAPGIGRGGGLFGQKPLTDDDLRLVPRKVFSAGVNNFDLAAMYKYIERSFEALAPDAYRRALPYLDQLETTIGLKIHDDLLAAFADTWVFYDAPSHAGLWIFGQVAIGELRPGNHLQETLVKLIGFINETGGQGRLLTLDEEEYRGQKVCSVRIHGVVGLPVTPAWAIHRNWWILAASPQVVQIVLDHQIDQGPSLLDNPDFQRGRKLLPPNCSSIGYGDAASGVKQVHGLVAGLIPLLVEALKGQGVDLPLTAKDLPSAITLTKHAFGSVSGMVTTPEGVLSVHHGAYPLSFSGSSAGAAMAGLTGGMLGPLLSRPPAGGANGAPDQER
ncbi:MAG: hypothetical protein AMXMBFR83_08060 [Phycisphaerae bacterium]